MNFEVSKDDLIDLFLKLVECAAEHYDNALEGLSFNRDHAEILIPIDILIDTLPEDFVLKIDEDTFNKYVSYYKGE